MKGIYRSIVASAFLLLLNACGGGGGGGGQSGVAAASPAATISTRQIPDPLSCEVPEFNRWMEADYFRQFYLWADSIPLAIQGENYDDSQQLFYEMRNANDRFSFMMTEDEYAKISAGNYTGLGVTGALGSNPTTYQITRVFEDSAAGRAGWQRGDYLLGFDEFEFATMSEQALVDALNELSNRSEVKVSIRRNGEVIEYPGISASTVTTDTVSALSYFDVAGEKLAYFSHYEFTRRAQGKLDEIFKEMRQTKPDELILDLRGNTGGIVSQALLLANDILQDVNNSHTGKVIGRLIHNQRRSVENDDYRFIDTDYGIGIKKLYVLTDAATCSASEQLIMFLKPYIPVEVIGGTTCGKPTGMEVKVACDQAMFGVSFKMANQNYVSDWYDGLTPSCAVDEDYTQPFGAATEPLLAQALALSRGQSCGSAAPQARSLGRARALRSAPRPLLEADHRPPPGFWK